MTNGKGRKQGRYRNGAQKPAGRSADERLVERAAAGDSEALEQLLHDYRPLLKRVAADAAAAGMPYEDALQEAMIALFLALRSYRPSEGSFPAYAKVLVERRVIDALRASGRVKQRLLSDALSLEELNESGGCEAPALQNGGDQSGDTLERLIERERYADLEHEIMSRLSTRERAVLQLRAAGLSYREIARTLQIREKQVDNAIQRCRQKIRRLYTEGEMG